MRILSRLQRLLASIFPTVEEVPPHRLRTFAMGADAWRDFGHAAVPPPDLSADDLRDWWAGYAHARAEEQSL